jgi:transcription-repair coupling factor (superfamily II helicase)
VKVKFTNAKNKEQNFDQGFSFYADFDQNKSLASVERDLIETISDQIILDIFNKSVANW